MNCIDNLDWNWFFSSLSQSTAAIVGIFGAFIITKILSNQVAFLEKSNRLKELIANAQKIVDNTDALHFRWYNAYKLYEQIARMSYEEIKDMDAKQIYNKYDFSIYSEKSFVIDEIEKELEKLKTEHSIRQPINDEKYNKLEKEEYSIDREIRNAKHHIRLISNFLDSVYGNPESSPQIRYVLILTLVLFFAGVIYPLSFMPMDKPAVFDLSIDAFFQLFQSLKGLLLLAVSIIFTVIVVIFYRMNEIMKYSSEDLQQLELFSKLGSYSKYFAIMESNMELNRKMDLANCEG